MLWGTRG
jgi:hypothetical protein